MLIVGEKTINNAIIYIVYITYSINQKVGTGWPEQPSSLTACEVILLCCGLYSPSWKLVSYLFVCFMNKGKYEVCIVTFSLSVVSILSL